MMGYKVESDTYSNAAGRGHVNCLEYLDSIRCPVSADVVEFAIKHDQARSLEYFIRENMYMCRMAYHFAYKYNSVECLEFIRRAETAEIDSFDFYDQAYIITAQRGDIVGLKFLVDKGIAWDKGTSGICARYDHIDCLIYVYEHGCELNDDICTCAARGGSIHCLIYAHKNGSKLYPAACSEAAKYGNLECIKYLHENGCEWDGSAYVFARCYDNYECIQYLIDNKCPTSASHAQCNKRNGCIYSLLYDAYKKMKPDEEHAINIRAMNGDYCIQFDADELCAFIAANKNVLRRAR
jgi:hypothetical protein